MSRKKHIGTRNLVVCDTFDEFAEKVELCNQNVEDVVGYITSMSRVFYWSNVESVWGILGFVWDAFDTETTFDSPWNTLEHVIAAGKNIDGEHEDLTPEEQKQLDDAIQRRLTKVKSGWGHFNATTIPFTVIPKLPDGYRIKKFNSAFNLIKSKNLELSVSDWSNLIEISNFLPIGTEFKANLEGANIKIINGLLHGNSKGNLYIKGDFSSVEHLRLNLDSRYYNNSYRYYTYVHNPLGCFTIDDDNKNLNFNVNLLTGNDHGFPIIRWQGEGVWQDEYVYSGLDVFSGKLSSVIIADNYNIEITAIGTKGNRIGNRVYTEYYREGYTDIISNKAITSSEPCLNVIINPTLNRDIDLNYILCEGLTYPAQHAPNGYSSRGKNYNLNPIVINGDYDSINAYNPYLNLSNGYPEYDATLISKLRKNEMAHILSKCNYIDKYISCPYQIDTTNLDYIDIDVVGGINAIPTLSDCTECNLEQLQGNHYAIDLLPKLENVHTFKEIWMPTDNPKALNCTLYYRVQSIKADKISARGFYMPEGVVFETSNMPHYYQSGCYINDSNKIHFKAYAKDGYMNIQGFCSQGYDFIFLNHTDINYIQIDERDPDVLKNSNVFIWNAIPANGYSYLQPIIITNRNAGINYGFILDTRWYNKHFNPSFIFIYRASLQFMFYDVSNNYITIDDIANIIDGIQPLPENDVLLRTYTIRMKNWIYEGLSSKTKDNYGNYINYIEQHLGYVIYAEN